MHKRNFRLMGMMVWASLTVSVRLANTQPTGHLPFPDIHNRNSLCIRLQRLACYGPCPIYDVEVHGNGDVFYNGIGGILLIGGKHHDHIPEAALTRLVSAFQEADYLSLEETYATANTDSPTYITSIEFDGRKKTVVDHEGRAMGLPKAARALENLMDEVTQSAKWRLGTADTVPSLLREHWDFRANTEDNDKLFAAAVFRPEILALYLKRGLPPLDAPRPNDNPLVAASLYPNPSLLVKLLRQSENLVPKSTLNLALSAAAGAALIPNMRFLVAHGADPNGLLPGNIGSPAMISAVTSGKAAAVLMLLAAGADVNATGNDDETALTTVLTHTTNKSEDVSIVRALIKAGANVNVQTSESDMNQTPVFLASDSPHATTVLRLLVAAGANVNAQDRFGRTPLMTCFDVDYAKALIKFGADPFAKDNTGKRAIDAAREMGERNLVQLLEAEMLRHPQQH